MPAKPEIPATKTFSAEQFPLTSAALAEHNSRRGNLFAESLLVLNSHLAAGEVRGKKAYADLRSDLTRVLETAYQHLVSEPYFYSGAGDNQPDELREYSYLSSGFASIGKALRVCQKLEGKNECAGVVVRLLKEWVPLVDALNWLKDMVISARAPAGVAAPRAAIPKSEMSEVVWTAIEAYKPTLEADYAAYIRRVFERLAGVFGARLEGVAGYYLPGSDGKRENTWRRVYERSFAGLVSFPAERPCSLIEPALADAAKGYADRVAEGMGHKIMSKAGELDSPVVRYIKGMDFEISGEKSGHRVLIQQSTKLVQNSLGTIFNQFPALIYVDGKFMSEFDYKTLLGETSSVKVVVHWEATVYGKRSKSCAASAQAVRAFSGRLTTAPSDVTCERCKKIVLDLKIRRKLND